MTTKVIDLLNEYFLDPNCRPADWIASEEVTEQEKALFISVANDKILFDKFLDSLEYSHP